MRPESAASGRTLSWYSVAALVLVPLLGFAVLIGLVTQPEEDAVSAAIVNLDEPVTVMGQYVPMGRQLAAAIISEGDEAIAWTLADETSAAEGLRSGEYSMVVTIPAEFSAAATSFSENDAAVATQAVIGLEMGENAPIADAQLGEQIARIATGTLNSTLTETYLDNVFIGLNSVGDQFGQIIGAVDELGGGSAQLAEGAGQAAEGAGELADGLGQLADGASQLSAGGSQLAGGSGELASGASQLAGGAQQLSGGVNELSSGAQELSSGASDLNAGGATLAAGVNELAQQAPALVDGVGQLATGAQALLGEDGVPAFAAGSKQVVLGVGQLAAGLDQAVEGISNEETAGQLQALTEGAAGVATGAAGVSGGLNSVNGTLGGLASGNAQAQGAAGQIAGGVLAAIPCPSDDPAVCGAFTAAVNAAALEGFKAGAGAGVQALNTDQGAGSLLGAASQVAEGASQLAGGVSQIPGQFEELASGLAELSAGANQIVTEAQPLVEGADDLGAGATALLAGINQLNGQVGALPAGIDQLAGGVNQLSGGIGQLAGGIDQFADGAGQLAGGASELSGGASDLAGGASQLSSGVNEYVGGVGQLADGTAEAAAGAPDLVTGLDQLADGASQLDDGIGTFGDELAAGAADLPAYTDADRATLSQVVANPVQPQSGVAGFNSTATVSLLIVAGLWLAAMLAFAMVRPVPANAVSSRSSSFALWARTISLPAIVVALQGVVFGVIGGTILNLGLGATLLLALGLAALGVSFVLANHALTAWLGNWGRGIAVLLLGATVAVAVSSVGSGWLGWLDAVSPLQNAFLLVRTQAADGSGMVGLLGGALLLGVVALAASVLSIASRRSLSAAQYRRHIDA